MISVKYHYVNFQCCPFAIISSSVVFSILLWYYYGGDSTRFMSKIFAQIWFHGNERLIILFLLHQDSASIIFGPVVNQDSVNEELRLNFAEFFFLENWCINIMLYYCLYGSNNTILRKNKRRAKQV